MMALCDFAGQVVDVNPAVERILGYTAEELKGIPYMELIHPDDLDGALTELASLITGGVTVNYRMRVRCKDGSYRRTQWSSTSSPEAELIFSVGRDVTEQTRLETFRENFIANAAHELRNPVSVIAGMSSLLAERKALTDSQYSRAVETVQRQSERLLRLVENMLNLSRLERGRISVQPRPLVLLDAIGRAIESNPAPEGKKLVVDIDNTLQVNTDPSVVDQVMTNLLTNSYRHGGRNVAIEAASTPAGVILTVSDDGLGVPNDLVPNLFEPFATAASGDGTGLGLAIVRMLIEESGDSIRYEPSYPRGARFVVTLQEVRT